MTGQRLGTRFAAGFGGGTIESGRLPAPMPINPDIQRHIRAVLNAHDEAFRVIRAANEALGAAHQEIGTAVKAHDDAIAAALAANRAAIDLLEYLSGNGQ